MKRILFTLSLLLGMAVVALPHTVAQDTLLDFSDIEFTESPDTSAEAMEYIGVHEDVVFSDGQELVDSAAGQAVLAAADGDATGGGTPQTLWGIFVAGFLGGFLAILMPCIYPLIPLTVSFFTKRAETKGKGIQGALLYGLSIIVIYVALGLLVTVIFGASALNELATNGIFNIFIFLVLLIFGISFLGAFEITLPSAFVNKVDSKSDAKGLIGIFFMAATLAVVSFSCTGPIIGSVIVLVNQTGNYLGPVIGMFGFSLALALVFTVFAIFPSWMTSLPKSGGWLNSVKVVLGFLEIALALKFLSTADLVYHWGILDREVFLVLWIVIASFIGLYLLGKIKLSHDSDLPHISIVRLFLSGGFFAFALYMVPGLWGAPLKVISGLVPPMHTQDFRAATYGQRVSSTAAPESTSGQPKKYSDFLHVPNDIDGYLDYEEALQYAKTVNKPLFLDFTGHGCVNCREMENNVWVDPAIDNLLRNEYIVVSLYTDERRALPEDEQFYSDVLKREVNTIGKKFMHLQADRFNSISQPYYVLYSPEEELLVSPPVGAEFDKQKFLAYLALGLKNFNEKQIP
ncbi:protein-disulfide reductase DsbD family protein [Parapedobacter sp. 10938]|uniref:protein-disulfide reductase DsbD family protein n=1 Tax=Parapedobacter flavus TaxID=3110225 RepID=UPI002DBAF1B2|nr:cytochrome c biogenesis protein CcdA [Parapedobacter sp. 10938]MEC3880018.1 cytochrome c biogenesis protein CcdA [Parapedobacter sp. 10938]